MDLKVIGELLLSCVDVPKAKKVLALQIVVPMVEAFVKDTANPYDDKVVEFLKDWIEKNV